MNLHKAIINIPCDVEKMYLDQSNAYMAGHMDARHASAELALKADDTIAELTGALAIRSEDYEHAVKADAEIAKLHSRISDIKCSIIDCFSNQVIACDGILSVSVDSYNNLVDAVNNATSRLNSVSKK